MPDPLFDDTIAAVATAPGRAAVALLRVSGRGAGAVLLRVCPELRETLPEPRRQRLLALRHPETDELIDRALVSWFPAPGSYTGEDTAELSTHGGALTPTLALAALQAAGARLAEPGEFTRRALHHGRLDLLQAEAVLDLIDGGSPALHRAAVHQMERGLSQRILELRGAILQAEALLVYGIDFPEEDEPPVPPQRVVAATRDVAARIDQLLRTAPEGELLRDGALVVLAGRPNSGKSSLFNALLGTERAIVTDLPGTTRDALEATLTVGGYPFRLVDTAGLRDTADRIEEMGIEVARRYLGAARVVLFCAEAGRPLGVDECGFLAELDPLRTILVRTMSDLGRPQTERSANEESVEVSAHSGEGVPELRARLLRLAFGGIAGEVGEAPLLTRERHIRAFRRARAELDAFGAALEDGIPAEVAATHLRAAAAELEELVGAITPDDLLGEVFGRFCVGK